MPATSQQYRDDDNAFEPWSTEALALAELAFDAQLEAIDKSERYLLEHGDPANGIVVQP